MMVARLAMMFSASLKASAGTLSSKEPSRVEVSTCVSHTAKRKESVATEAHGVVLDLHVHAAQMGRALSVEVTRHTRPTISDKISVGSSTALSMA